MNGQNMDERIEKVSGQKEIKEIATKNFSRWNNALITKNPNEIAKLYAEDATFLPTLSGDLKKGISGAEDYFKHFLEKNPTSKIVKDEVQSLGPNCYLHSGIYNFEICQDETRQTINARFSFVWKLDKQGVWKIIHHHSSLCIQNEIGEIAANKGDDNYG